MYVTMYIYIYIYIYIYRRKIWTISRRRYGDQCLKSTETRCVAVCVRCSVCCSGAALLQCVLQCGLQRYGGHCSNSTETRCVLVRAVFVWQCCIGVALLAVCCSVKYSAMGVNVRRCRDKVCCVVCCSGAALLQRVLQCGLWRNWGQCCVRLCVAVVLHCCSVCCSVGCGAMRVSARIVQRQGVFQCVCAAVCGAAVLHCYSVCCSVGCGAMGGHCSNSTETRCVAVCVVLMSQCCSVLHCKMQRDGCWCT